MTSRPADRAAEAAAPDVDVVVVGAGAGGIYAVHTFVERGYSVQGIESASDVGGVWFHNRYPGARVDVESYYYCYMDPALYRDWTWTERYPAQPEILAYLQYAADRYGVRPYYRFNTWVVGAQWNEQDRSYRVSMSDGDTVTCRYLVMTAGQLSKPRRPAFAGLDDFEGEWLQTSLWPDHPVSFAGRRVAVIGTGSSGVQVIPEIAREAEHLYVFQRTPNYSVPAQNGPLDTDKYADISDRVPDEWSSMLQRPAGAGANRSVRLDISGMTALERRTALEERWAEGGHSMNTVFTDQSTNIETNTIVADFVREKIRDLVEEPSVAEALLPTAYPIGTRRLCVDNGYYQTFNRDNVTLVDVRRNPIESLTPRGVMTHEGEIEVDLIVFALGFEAFTGAIDQANITNDQGVRPSDRWARGPRTYLGMMTAGFPNLFLVTGPGSPSVLANMIAGNQFHIDYIAALLDHMRISGRTRVEPSERAEEAWAAVMSEAAGKLLRKNVENYMVHVNDDDGSRVFIPFSGGLDAYVRHCQSVAAEGYEGFVLD